MMFRKIAAAALAAVMAVTACGCSVKVGTNKKIKDTAVVATAKGVDDKSLDITYGDFRKEYVYWLKAKNYTDDSLETVAEECKAQREDIIGYLINEKIILAEAAKLGIDKLSDEETLEIQEKFDSLVQQQVDYFASKAKAETTEDGAELSEKDLEQRGNDDFDSYLADCGLTRDDLFLWQVSAYVSNKVLDEVTKDVVFTREEAEKEFADIEATIEAAYKANSLSYEQNSTYTSLWLPEGSRRIKHILLGFEDTAADEISALRTAGDDEAADALRAEKAEALAQQTQEVINMLDNGGDFDELINELSADKLGSSSMPDGYLVVPEGQTYMAEFQQKAMELPEVGAYDTCVTDYGVHIMLYASDAVIPEEEKTEFIDYLYEQMFANKKDVRFGEILDEWKATYNYKIDYDALKIDAPEAQAE